MDEDLKKEFRIRAMINMFSCDQIEEGKKYYQTLLEEVENEIGLIHLQIATVYNNLPPHDIEIKLRNLEFQKDNAKEDIFIREEALMRKNCNLKEELHE